MVVNHLVMGSFPIRLLNVILKLKCNDTTRMSMGKYIINKSGIR